jgi:hypothetical protein
VTVLALRLEVLKLATRPAALLWLALTVGGVIVVVLLRLVFHATSPGTQGFHGPPGGGDGYRAALEGLSRFAFLAALLIGATAGTTDRASGVLRELAVTGVSRLRLFLLRLPAAVLVAEALALIGFAIALFAGLLLPDGGPMVDFEAAAHDGALLVVSVGTAASVVLGLATLVRSRAAAIVVFFAFETTVAPFILHDESIGRLRWLLLTPAINRFARPELELETLGIPLAVAALVIIGWITVLNGAAAWRETVREL